MAFLMLSALLTPAQDQKQAADPEPPAVDGWALFRGNVAQTGAIEVKLPDKLEELWKFKTEDAFEGAVAIVGGVVYAGCMDEHLYALDLATGKERWKFKMGPIQAAPAVKGGSVFVGDKDGMFYCIDALKGTKKWSFETGAEIGGANFHGDTVLFASHDEHLYCLTKDGKQQWKFRTDGPAYGSPAVMDGKTFLVGCDKLMHVIDVKTGKEIRSVDIGGQTGASAAVDGNLLYIGTMSSEVKALDWQKGEESWTYRAPQNAQSFFSSPAVTKEYVVIGSRDYQLHCIQRKTGAAVWSHPTKGKVESSPVVVGDRVVVGSLDRHLYVLDLASGKEVQKIRLDGAVSASPAVVGGKVIIGTQKGTLYCLGARAK